MTMRVYALIDKAMFALRIAERETEGKPREFIAEALNDLNQARKQIDEASEALSKLSKEL